MIALSALFGLALAAAFGLPAANVVLGNSPGGIAEMAITAAVLHLGVPMVTAFHVLFRIREHSGRKPVKDSEQVFA